MRETGKVGIATVVIRSKEQLVALRPIGDVMGMTTMVFPDEVVDPSTLDELEAADEVETSKQASWTSPSSWSTRSPSPSSPIATATSTASRSSTMIERKASGEEIVGAGGDGGGRGAPSPDLMAP